MNLAQLEAILLSAEFQKDLTGIGGRSLAQHKRPSSTATTRD
jgi:hypothetical protein